MYRNSDNWDQKCYELTKKHSSVIENHWANSPWPKKIDPQSIFFSSELVSVRHLSEYQNLNKKQKNLIKSRELKNFFSINIDGESQLILDFRNLLKVEYPKNVVAYIKHFMEDEVRHSKWFVNFVNSYLGGKFSSPLQIKRQSLTTPLEVLVVIIKIYIFERMSMHYNKVLSEDPTVHDLVRNINFQHYIEEQQHLIFDEEAIRSLWQSIPENEKHKATLLLQRTVEGFLGAHWLSYYNSEIYESVFPEPLKISDKAYNHPKQVLFRQKVTDPIIDSLKKIELPLISI